MKVLSLFDGIATGRLALERAGIQVDEYYASEIDEKAIKIAKKNFPDIIHIGDVSKVDFSQYKGKIDILLGGSPCQGFSFAGKQLNFNDPRSKLFFEYVRALNEIQPKYFLLENVNMKQEFKDVITEHLGVGYVDLDSALISAQHRRRMYWFGTFIDGKQYQIPITVPVDKKILLKDIVHEYCGDIIDYDKYLLSETNLKNCNRNFGTKAVDITDKNKSNTLTASMGTGGGNIPFMFHELQQFIVPFDKSLQILEKEVLKGKIGYFRKDSQANRVYSIHNKAVCLCGDAGGGAAKMGQYLFGCITPDRINKKQNGQRFNDGNKFYTLTATDQHGVLLEGYIRKLTPIECERLQTLPDNYTKCDGVSNSNRYKALGNGWTCDMIVHILKHIPKTDEELLKLVQVEQESTISEPENYSSDCCYDCHKQVNLFEDYKLTKSLLNDSTNVPEIYLCQDCAEKRLGQPINTSSFAISYIIDDDSYLFEKLFSDN